MPNVYDNQTIIIGVTNSFRLVGQKNNYHSGAPQGLMLRFRSSRAACGPRTASWPPLYYDIERRIFVSIALLEKVYHYKKHIKIYSYIQLILQRFSIFSISLHSIKLILYSFECSYSEMSNINIYDNQTIMILKEDYLLALPQIYCYKYLI